MDAMTGRGELGDRGLVAAFHGWCGLADGRMLRSTEAWTGQTGADGADWGTGGCSRRSGLRNPRRGGLGQTGQVGADWSGRGRLTDAADYGILDGAD